MRAFLNSRLALVSAGHFTIDAYASFFTPLLPLLMAKLGLSLTAVGTLVALASLSTSMSQPLFGILSDRLRRPWFVAAGPFVAALFMSGLGLAPSYAALLAMLTLGGLGVSAFHPPSAALAREASARPGLAMSFFVTAGTLGYALGPLFAVTVVGAVGLSRTWVAALPGLVVASLLAFQFARLASRGQAARPRASLGDLRALWRPLSLLYVAVVCRSAVAAGFMTFLPIHLHARGYSTHAGGAVTTLYLAAGAIGGFLGGWLSERWGGRAVIRRSFVIAAPLFVAFLLLPDVPGIAALVLGSFALQSSLPVNVIMGQELSPRHASTISSLLMGFAWGAGALLIGPVGGLADLAGLRVALMVLTTLTAVGFACAMAMPDIRRHAAPDEPLLPVEPEPLPTGGAGR